MLKNKTHVLWFCLLLFTFCLFCFAHGGFKYDSRGRRNPFIALVTQDGRLLKLDEDQSDKGLFLEGIIYDGRGFSYAIVNGEVVKADETVAGYKVLRIQRDKVIFERDGSRLELELKKEEG
ncbi:MAG: hypothetical protein JW788_06660 [Candidatus Omnitrophica bacterium]|nr:hypothetical protein [Candidatus Omnitrophota bacterium]